MESTDSSTGSQQQQPNLPPGFRFHPTDEELVIHYLKKKASSAPLPVAIIAEVDLYKFDPWELPAKATFGEQEWYFFSPRDRKYPNGARPNRAATSGYWKATGTDKPVLASGGTQKVGVKKALVFYGGKPPKGIKTNWIMHEYRLAENKVNNRPPGFDLANKKNSLRLDDWVLCRIYKKNNTHRPLDHEREDSMDDMMGPNMPPPMSMGLLTHHQNAASKLLQFPNDQNCVEGMLNNDSNMCHQFVSSSSSKSPELSGVVAAASGNNAMSNTLFAPLKRVLPGLFWNDDDDDEAGPSPSKRLQLDNGMTSSADGNGSNSIATLLSQLPQTSTPSLHQQSLLGSLGDGLFRAPTYSLPGMNWYS
ncbi:hypothetical protein FNV43_RR16033 [Rhamnella rubrinervis]|uniref:NAC domain-containing protein n=1 Tax=Rhamnella rubrinervis TaxID=2594499 RepID=A0A8K0EDH3_9ROSA|nr:hypothetical protein FNV43_RR16033 [Rhamnella rubrinervis]